MPYTPPAQTSPASSKPNSPTPTRSHSHSLPNLPSSGPGPAVASRAQLPRSSASQTYLAKHRRSPSLKDPAKDILYHGEAYEGAIEFDPHGSLRKSPPPVNNARIPPGMTISPPDSAQTSDDEDHVRGRTRDLEEENLKELQAAIQIIQQRKESSPVRGAEEKTRVAVAEQLVVDQTDGIRPPLSREARKISHSRSNTDSSIVLDPCTLGTPPSLTKLGSDMDEESDGSGNENSRPPMLRKKSGELVRPALRAASRRRPSSMPGTPTYSKAVHFDSHLEHVRHFLQVDRPLAVSAGSSPVETYESENEFPFGGSDEDHTRSRQQPFEWEIKLPNFCPSLRSESQQSQPVQVERIFLSADNKNLIGCIAVKNLDFQKSVVIRFTFDYWKTTSELVAEFSHDLRPSQQNDGLDRFTFSLRLADQVNLVNKTLFFCVRYNVQGQEFWDNNGGYNYQVDFCKKPKPQYGKNGMPGLGARPLTALPRSGSQGPSHGSRPRPSPVSFDDFAAGFDSFASSGSPGILMGEPSIKLKGDRTRPELLPDAPTRKKSSGPKFGYRYDFSSSLTAAKMGGQTSSTATKQSFQPVDSVKAPIKSVLAEATVKPTAKAPAVTAKPGALFSEKPSLSSQSYRELVEKYCFFGTPKSSSSTSLTKTALNLVDGAIDDASSSEAIAPSPVSTPSDCGSPMPTSCPAALMPEKPTLSHYSPSNSRSSSPMPLMTGSRPTSPAFSYPYHASSQLMAEAPASIRA